MRKMLAATAVTASLFAAAPAAVAQPDAGMICITHTTIINGMPVTVTQCIPLP